jgi:uncharacterized membrane protein
LWRINKFYILHFVQDDKKTGFAKNVRPMNQDTPRPKPAGGAAALPSGVLPAALERLLRKYPGLVRHPHAFAVHFPIVFLYSAAFFDLLYLGTGIISLETSAFHFLGAGLLTLPLTMLTGEISRRLSYSQEPVQVFHIEIFYSRLLLVLSLAGFVWRWLDPQVLRDFGWSGLVYLLIILALPTLATYISYFGGLLTFPLEKEED